MLGLLLFCLLIRFQAIRVLGLLGALDPYRYKQIQIGGKEAVAKAASSEPISNADSSETTGIYYHFYHVAL